MSNLDKRYLKDLSVHDEDNPIFNGKLSNFVDILSQILGQDGDAQIRLDDGRVITGIQKLGNEYILDTD